MTADPREVTDPADHSDQSGQSGAARVRRTPAEAKADLDAAQAQLTATLDALRHQFTPEAAARKGLQAAKGVFVDRRGSIRPARIAIAGVAVVGVIVLIAAARRRGR